MNDDKVTDRQFYELKEKAIEFYAENDVPQKMEDILNTLFYDQPDDIYGHITNYFKKFTKTPTISKLKARQVLDSKGQQTIQTQVYCTVRNFEEFIASSVASSFNIEPEHASNEDKEQEEKDRNNGVERGVSYIHGALNTALQGHDPRNQRDADEKIQAVFAKVVEEENEEAERLATERANSQQSIPSPGSARATSVTSAKKGKSPKAKGGKGGGSSIEVVPDEPREKLLCGCIAFGAMSRTMSIAGSQLAAVPLYKHIASFGNEKTSFVMPRPMITIIASGRAYAGKSQCIKELMVIPKINMPIAESIQVINSIYANVAKALVAKTGGKPTARFVSDNGALCPAFDKPEIGLDMLQDAISAAGLTVGEDVFLAVNCAGQEIFDYDKGKYEVMVGVQKTAEDLVDFWVDILNHYPGIIALIDPMRKQEKVAWMRLCERVSEKCLIVGDFVYHRPGLLVTEEIAPDFKTNGVVLALDRMTTVTELLSACAMMGEENNQLIIGASQGESTDSFVSDLAVGCGAQFIKLGAPCRGERIIKINRLLEIEDELTSVKQLDEQRDTVFTPLAIPVPTPCESRASGEQEASPKKS